MELIALMQLDTFSTGLLAILPKSVSTLLLVYMIFKGLDMILGLLKTWKNDNYKSSKMRSGIISWIAELVGICFVLTIDLILGLDSKLTMFTLALFIYKETGSILENLCECGVELPESVANKLEVFNVQKKQNTETTENTNK